MLLHPDSLAEMKFPSLTELFEIVSDAVQAPVRRSEGEENKAENVEDPFEGTESELDLENKGEDVGRHPFVGAIRYLKPTSSTLPFALRQLDAPEGGSKEQRPPVVIPALVPVRERPPPSPVNAIILFFSFYGLLPFKALDAFKLVRGPEYKHTSTLSNKENSWIALQIQQLTALAEAHGPSKAGAAKDASPTQAPGPTLPNSGDPSAAERKTLWRGIVPRKETASAAPKRVRKHSAPIVLEKRLGLRLTHGHQPERTDLQPKWGSAYCILRGTCLEVTGPWPPSSPPPPPSHLPTAKHPLGPPYRPALDQRLQQSLCRSAGARGAPGPPPRGQVHALPYKEDGEPEHRLEVGRYQLFAICPDEGPQLGVFRLVRSAATRHGQTAVMVKPP